jgi:hypothetical protein
LPPPPRLADGGETLTVTASSQTIMEGQPGGPLAWFTDSDGDLDPSHFAFGGPINLSPAGSFDPSTLVLRIVPGTYNGQPVLEVVGDLSHLEETPSTNPDTISFVIVDLDDDAAPALATATVQVNDALLSGSGLTFTATANPPAPVTYTIAHFQDADPDAVSTDYTASYAIWPGTTTSDYSISISGDADNGFTVSGSHSFTAVGTQTFTVHIEDHNASVNLTATAIVEGNLTATGASIGGVEGHGISSATLATFSDRDGDTNPGDFTASVTWPGVANPPTAHVEFDSSSSVLKVVGNVPDTLDETHGGTVTGTVSITDNHDGATTTTGCTVTIDDALLHASIVQQFPVSQ